MSLQPLDRDQEQLFCSHRTLAVKIAQTHYNRNFNWTGLERDDYIGVAMIGLWQAASRFQPGRSKSFPTFAKLVINRQLASLWKETMRSKSMVLNSARSLDGLEHVLIVAETRNDRDSERCQRIVQKAIVECCTPLERRVLALYMYDELSYAEIAARLDCTRRTVDNALQRAKRKIGKAIAGRL